jgi:hypothetical protein
MKDLSDKKEKGKEKKRQVKKGKGRSAQDGLR